MKDPEVSTGGRVKHAKMLMPREANAKIKSHNQNQAVLESKEERFPRDPRKEAVKRTLGMMKRAPLR